MNKEELINKTCASLIKLETLKIKPEDAERMISKYIGEIELKVALGLYVETLKKETQEKIVNNTHPYIWGSGWYAIPDRDGENAWCLAPIKFFDEMGHCPDGWEWETPEGLSNEELNEFIDEHGCEPEIPKEFSYCMESTIECVKEIPMEEQKQILKDFGYVVDNIPKWKYDRKR